MSMLTTEQLAAHFGISARQVQRLAAAGLPSIPVGARGRRYDPDACEQWLQANREVLCPPRHARRRLGSLCLRPPRPPSPTNAAGHACA